MGYTFRPIQRIRFRFSLEESRKRIGRIGGGGLEAFWVEEDQGRQLVAMLLSINGTCSFDEHFSFDLKRTSR